MPPLNTPWRVHKFGGTSVANADRFRLVGNLLQKEAYTPRATVVSAMSGVTDALLGLVDSACRQSESYLSELEALRRRHEETVEALLGRSPLAAALHAVLEKDARELAEILKGIWHSRHAAEFSKELVAGYGELWSAQILNAHLRALGLKSEFVDARKVLVVEPSDRSVTVDWKGSAERLKQWLEAHPARELVVTGFIASTPQGIATTLKRNGSDHSATIFGRLLEAESVTIWTDVDGVLTADPRLVPDAVVLAEISYGEATELAHFGAKVVHPATMAPAIERNIPIWIRNTFHPEGAGTKIHAGPRTEAAVRGLALQSGVALLNLEGTGMAGIPGVAEKLFGALRSVGVSVILISQASSEQSICFAVPNADREKAKSAVEKAFYAEFHQGGLQSLSCIENCATLALVGDGMAHRPGVAGQFLRALGSSGVSVRAIAQGSSERNISVVVDDKDATRSLRVAHSAFYLSPSTLAIGVLGTGHVGKAFLSQLEKSRPRLLSQGLDIRLRAQANSRTMALGDLTEPTDLERLVEYLLKADLPHAVLIDLTADARMADRYRSWLEKGIDVITANKHAGSGELSRHEAIQQAARRHGRAFLYETTVGGGLPVLRTLRDLLRTGDEILKIESVLSGTLSFLFTGLSQGRPFSEVLTEAYAQGLTEPDPREDLSGKDFARKLVILAREMGRKLTLDDIEIESLVPQSLAAVPVETFLKNANALDVIVKERGWCATTRFVGRLCQSGKASVRAVDLPPGHPLLGLDRTDNLVAITSQRYQERPLVIQGAGAGPDVTAAGVFADLLRLSLLYGARV